MILPIRTLETISVRKLLSIHFVGGMVIALLFGALPRRAWADFSLPSGLAYVWWDFGIDEFEDFQIDLDLHTDPAQKEEDYGKAAGMYLQVYHGEIGNVDFSFGIQTDVSRPRHGGQGKGLIFSRKKTRDAANARTTADGWIESSDDEGDFVGICRKYDFGKGSYRLRLTAIDADEKGVWYGYFVLNRQTDQEDYCGALRFPVQPNSEQPRPRIKNGGGTWLEVYSQAKSLDQIPYWHVTVTGCYADHRRVSVQRASSDYSDQIPTADVEFDVARQATHFRVGRGAERKHQKTKVDFTTQAGNNDANHVVAAGKVVAQILEPGNHWRTINIEGRERTYLLHIPPSLPADQPAPLVLALHGAGMNASLMARTTNLSKKADEAGFIVAYPNGTGTGKASLLTWNSGGFGEQFEEQKPDDVAFLSAMIDDVAKVASIDLKRVHACGISNGGMMCYRLAAELSDRIASIAPVAGTIAIEKSEPRRPVSVLHFHGTKDRLVPYEGPQNKLPNFLTFQSVAESVDTWVKLNGCQNKPSTELLSQEGDELKVTRATYANGREGSEVVLITVADGGHTWPGRVLRIRLLGKTAKNISANDIIWEFFQKHPMP